MNEYIAGVVRCFKKWLQIKWDDARRLAKRQEEREQGSKDAAEDLSELSEEEGRQGITKISKDGATMSHIDSDIKMWEEGGGKSNHLYIVLIRWSWAWHTITLKFLGDLNQNIRVCN